jgi:peptide/nickel transport system substrate-binding protein
MFPPRLTRTAAVLILGLACACAPSDETRRSSILVVAIGSAPGHLNPAITTGGGVHTASELLYNGLLRLDALLVPQPDLAESWEVLDGGRRYRFHLRRDVRWHDGEAFGAEDVAYTLSEVLVQYHSRTRASLGAVLSDVQVIDEHTVDIVLDSPYAPLLQQLDVTEAPILPAHVFRGTDPLTNPANRAPIGTGPFRFEVFTSSEIRYAANEEFFDGRPALDGVVLRVIVDPGTSVIALESGEVDWLFGVPGPDLPRISAMNDIRLLETSRGAGGSNCVNTLVFNLERAPFSDVRMRRAIAHAIDRSQIVERVLFDAGHVAAAPISSGIPWAHRPGLQIPDHDPSAAEALLEEMGWVTGPDGMRVAEGVSGVADGTALEFDFTHMPGFVAYGDVLRAHLRRVGIALRPLTLEQASFAETVFVDRNFDTSIVSYCNGPDPEIGVRRQYISSNIGPIPFSNGAAYSNARVDSLFDAARAGSTLVERGRIYGEIQEIAVRDLPYFWLTESISIRAYRTRCTGFTGDGHYARTARCNE